MAPRKSPGEAKPRERRDILVAFRLTSSEDAPFTELMKEAELNRSDFYRQLLLNKSPVINKPSKDYDRLLFYYGKSSNNLNQLAHSINLSWKKGIVSERLYIKLLNDLMSIRQLLMAGIEHADQG